jgi:hypothetical protein
VSAEVIRLHDVRARRAGVIDDRTELERLIAEARTEGRREGRAEGFYDGMRAAMESMHVTPPTMLDDRRALKSVRVGGRAS